MKETYSGQPESSVELNSQNNLPKSKSSKTLYLVILISLMALALGGISGYILGLGKSTQIISQPAPPQPKTSPTSFTSPTIAQAKKERQLLMEKEIENGRIAAYRLVDEQSFDLKSDAYSVALESGENHPEIFSVSSPVFQENELFDITGNELFVVNSQTNKIDVYIYQSEKGEDNLLQRSSLTFEKSIDLPKYRVGVLYSIKCDKQNCVISTAFHQESGCSMDLSLTTRQYSNIICFTGQREFIPELL